MTRGMRRLLSAVPLVMMLASCVAKPPPRPAPAPAPPSPPAVALPAAPPRQDWRDVALTPGTWTWRRAASGASLAQFGVAGEGAVLALRCDLAGRAVIVSRAGTSAAPGTMTFTTSFGPFTIAATPGGGDPPAIVARLAARDPRLDQLAFSRGRFLVEVAGQDRLVIPAWPEVSRVIEDCRG